MINVLSKLYKGFMKWSHVYIIWKEHADTSDVFFDGSLIACFAYFQNMIGWIIPDLVISQSWKEYGNVLGKCKCFIWPKVLIICEEKSK